MLSEQVTDVLGQQTGRNSKMSTKSNTAIQRRRDFARRLKIACDAHSECPSDGGAKSGRKTWVAKQVSRKIETTVYSAKKWFDGESMPTDDRMDALASVLRVRKFWLAHGEGDMSEDGSDIYHMQYADTKVLSDVSTYSIEVIQKMGVANEIDPAIVGKAVAQVYLDHMTGERGASAAAIESLLRFFLMNK